MKILVPTSTHPEKNSALNIYIKNIQKNLQEIGFEECIWFVYESNKIIKKEKNIFDIHDYSNAVEVLKEIKPDCVITNNNKFDVISYAFSLGAKFQNIPLIFYKSGDFGDLDNTPNYSNIKRNFLRNFNKMLLKESNSKKFHISFVRIKNNFLSQTKKETKSMLSENHNSIIEQYKFYLLGNIKNRFSNLADLNLVNNEKWWNTLKDSGIDESKMKLVGNPYWDNFYQITKNRKLSRKIVSNKPIKILIVTTPLVEHGHWTEKFRDKFLKNIIEILDKSNEFKISLKIHPSSETLEVYKKLINNKSDEIKIFQRQSLWSIIDDFDIILSYGYSMIHIEIALVGKRMIFIDMDEGFREMPLIESAIKSGFIEKTKKIENLPILINKLCNKPIQFSDNHKNEIERLIFKFDGNSGRRNAYAIYELLVGKNRIS